MLVYTKALRENGPLQMDAEQTLRRAEAKLPNVMQTIWASEALAMLTICVPIQVQSAQQWLVDTPCYPRYSVISNKTRFSVY